MTKSKFKFVFDVKYVYSPIFTLQQNLNLSPVLYLKLHSKYLHYKTQYGLLKQKKTQVNMKKIVVRHIILTSMVAITYVLSGFNKFD